MGKEKSMIRDKTRREEREKEKEKKGSTRD